MPIKSKSDLALIVSAAVIASLLLAVSFWVVPHSLTGWLALLVIGVPVWLVLEWLGEAALNLPVLQPLPSTARILVGVPFVIALMVVALLVAMLARDIVIGL